MSNASTEGLYFVLGLPVYQKDFGGLLDLARYYLSKWLYVLSPVDTGSDCMIVDATVSLLHQPDSTTTIKDCWPARAKLLRKRYFKVSVRVYCQ